jgi:hypothetical protein
LDPLGNGKTPDDVFSSAGETLRNNLHAEKARRLLKAGAAIKTANDLSDFILP